MEEQLIDDVLDLRVQGYSIRDIAAELGIKKSQVERMLNEHRYTLTKMQGNVSDEPDGNRSTVTDEQTAETIRQLEEIHQQIVREKAVLESRNKEMERLLALTPNKQQVIEEFRRKTREEKLVARSNRLLNEVLENCDNCSWSDDEIDDFLERCENLKDRLKAFCDANDIDERKLLVYQAIDFIISSIEDDKAQSRSGIFSVFSSGVTLDYSEDFKQKIRSFLASDFAQTMPSAVTVTGSPRQSTDSDWTDDDE